MARQHVNLSGTRGIRTRVYCYALFLKPEGISFLYDASKKLSIHLAFCSTMYAPCSKGLPSPGTR